MAMINCFLDDKTICCLLKNNAMIDCLFYDHRSDYWLSAEWRQWLIFCLMIRLLPAEWSGNDWSPVKWSGLRGVRAEYRRIWREGLPGRGRTGRNRHPCQGTARPKLSLLPIYQGTVLPVLWIRSTLIWPGYAHISYILQIDADPVPDLTYKFDADPDADSDTDFHLMQMRIRMRIQVTKMMRIRIQNTDCSTFFYIVPLWFCKRSYHETYAPKFNKIGYVFVAANPLSQPPPPPPSQPNPSPVPSLWCDTFALFSRCITWDAAAVRRPISQSESA